MFKRDLKTTATGWPWLDRLTYPWWRLRSAVAERRLLRLLGDGDRAVGLQMLRDAAASQAMRREAPRP